MFSKDSVIPFKCGTMTERGGCLSNGIQLGRNLTMAPEYCKKLCKEKSDKVQRPACCAYDTEKEFCYWHEEGKWPLIVLGNKFKSVLCKKGYIKYFNLL